MKRGYMLLVAGAGVFVAGITIAAVWDTAFAGAFLSQNTVTKNAIIDPGKSIDQQTTVTALDRPVSIAISVAQNGQAGTSSFREEVKDPSGNIVSRNEFTNAIFTTFSPTSAGVYRLTVTNIGTQPAMINGAFGHVPFIGANGKPDFSSPGSFDVVMITVGAGLAGAGVLMMIGGGVLAYMERRSNSQGQSSTTEGGVTYRKD